MPINSEMIDALLQDYAKPDDVLAQNGLLKQLTTALLERARTAESRPRFAGFDDRIVSMFVRGADTAGIRKRLNIACGVDVSLELIADVIGALAGKLQAWQNRTLESVYPIVFLDTLHIRVKRPDGVEALTIYVPVGIDLDGRREVLGFWAGDDQGAGLWLDDLRRLRERGVNDILLVCADKLAGLGEALQTAYPQAQLHLHILHMIQASLGYVGRQDCRRVELDLRPIYQAATPAQATAGLADFSVKWGASHGAVLKLWEENWERVLSFCALPEEVRRVLSSTNALQALNRHFRQALKRHSSFPDGGEPLTLLYAATLTGPRDWEYAQNWRNALNRFEVKWGDRIKSALAPQTAQSGPPELALVSSASADCPPPPVH